MISVIQIKMARSAIGWTQSKLARASNVSFAAIARIEQSPKDANVTIKTLGKIEKALKNKGVIFSSTERSYLVEVPKEIYEER